MKKKQQHVYPPFPSFAWVMTTQANPPAPAYAYGYVQSAHAHNGPHPHPRHPSAHRANHKAHRHPKRPLSSPTRVRAAAQDEKLMKTVDYRYHDPPFRPYVPWHEGYTLRGRGAQQPHRQQHHHHHQRHHQMQHALPPDFPISSRARTPPAVGAAVSRCECIDGSDEESDVVRRKKKTTTADVVNIKRLDIMLGALGRVCRLSKVASKGSGGPSMLT